MSAAHACEHTYCMFSGGGNVGGGLYAWIHALVVVGCGGCC